MTTYFIPPERKLADWMGTLSNKIDMMRELRMHMAGLRLVRYVDVHRLFESEFSDHYVVNNVDNIDVNQCPIDCATVLNSSVDMPVNLNLVYDIRNERYDRFEVPAFQADQWDETHRGNGLVHVPFAFWYRTVFAPRYNALAYMSPSLRWNQPRQAARSAGAAARMQAAEHLPEGAAVIMDVNGEAVVVRHIVEDTFLQTEGAIDESEYPAAAQATQSGLCPGNNGAAGIGKLPWQAPPKQRIEQVSAEAKDGIDALIAEIDGIITKEGEC